MDEKHPQDPINPYGESKFFVEKILKAYDKAYGLKFTALRYFNAAGADPKGRIGESPRAGNASHSIDFAGGDGQAGIHQRVWHGL